MPSYTVESVVSSEEWSGDRGPMVTYELMLEGEPQTVKLIRQAKSSAPSVGDSLDGTITAGKLKLDYAGGGQGGGERRSGGGKSFDRQPDHPVQMQRALHTSSLSTAIPLIEQMFTLGVSDVKRPESKEEYLALVRGVADWVQSTYPPAVLEQAAKADAS